MIKGIYGINVAVRDLDQATKAYEQALGSKSEPVGESGFAFPGLRGSRFKLGGFTLNLITSDDETTSVGRFLSQKGEGFFLLSVESGDLEADLDALRANGFKPLLAPSAAGEFGAVNFLHPKQLHGVQLEIYQPANGA